jgi:hypothetical protein
MIDANLVQIREMRDATAARDAAIVERTRREMTAGELDAIADRLGPVPRRGAAR